MRFKALLLLSVGLSVLSCNVDKEITQEDLGANFRKATSSSSICCNKVYEYMPAPGQFINEGFTATTMEQACSYAESRLSQKYYVSLGGWGGYIVVGFDHSIVNKGGYDFRIKGNAIEGSSEPGIVWVMQDVNGNGYPDDTWYELAGSEHGKTTERHGFSITYYRPSGNNMPVRWRDADQTEGEIDYLSSEHNQDSYYPKWVSADSYTLFGVRLDANNRQFASGTWSNDPYEWGYADNKSSEDYTSDGYNKFKIGNAVTSDGEKANLKFIDFIKVQTATNAKSGILGENSTDVLSIEDMHIK